MPHVWRKGFGLGQAIKLHGTEAVITPKQFAEMRRANLDAMGPVIIGDTVTMYNRLAYSLGEPTHIGTTTIVVRSAGLAAWCEQERRHIITIRRAA